MIKLQYVAPGFHLQNNKNPKLHVFSETAYPYLGTKTNNTGDNHHHHSHAQGN
jgi:hypothetical protein